MLADLRLALRGLRRAPGFTLAAVLCVALGVGANTAIFSAVGAVLLHPVATPAIERVVAVRQDLIPIKLLDFELAPPEVLDLGERRELFDAVAGHAARGFVLERNGTSTRFEGARTLGDFFTLFRVRPHLGRLYTAADSRDGRHQVAVLTYGLWQEQFGGDPGVVGRTVRLNDAPHEVVGVLPADFRYPREARVLVPMRVDSTFARAMRGRQIMTALARLRDGVTPEGAQAGLARVMAEWRGRDGAGSTYGVPGQHRMYVTPFVAFDAGQLRPVLHVLLGAVALVLLIACANVASLQLVRAAARTRELAVQAAVGAGRARIARRLLLESALVAGAGGALGLAVGWATTRLLVALAPADRPALRDLRLDGPVLLATALVAAAAAVLSGTLPALRGARVDLRAALQEGARGGTAGGDRQRVLRGAVVVQVALSFVLLLGSGVMLRSLARLLAVDPGFRPARVTAAAVALPFARYAKPADALRFYAELTERLRATPGVEAWASRAGSRCATTPTAPRSRDRARHVGPDRAAARPHRVRRPRLLPRHGHPAPARPHVHRPAGRARVGRRARVPHRRGAGAQVLPRRGPRRPAHQPGARRRDRRRGGERAAGGVGRARQGARLLRRAAVVGDGAHGGRPHLAPGRRGRAHVRAAAAAVDPRVPLYDVAAMPDVVPARGDAPVRGAGARRLRGGGGDPRPARRVRRAELRRAAAPARAGHPGGARRGPPRDRRARASATAAPRRAGDSRLGRGGLLLALGRGLEAARLRAWAAATSATLAGGRGAARRRALAASWLPARRATRVDPGRGLRGDYGPGRPASAAPAFGASPASAAPLGAAASSSARPPPPMLADLRLALRALRRAPAFTLAAALTLASASAPRRPCSASSTPCCCARSPCPPRTGWWS
jgi:hypothetical protein